VTPVGAAGASYARAGTVVEPDVVIVAPPHSLIPDSDDANDFVAVDPYVFENTRLYS